MDLLRECATLSSTERIHFAVNSVKSLQKQDADRIIEELCSVSCLCDPHLLLLFPIFSFLFFIFPQSKVLIIHPLCKPIVLYSQMQTEPLPVIDVEEEEGILQIFPSQQSDIGVNFMKHQVRNVRRNL